VLCLAGVLASGCSSGGDGDAPAGVTQTPADDPVPGAPGGAPGDVPIEGSLAGAWDGCTGAGLRSTYVFTADRFDQYLAFFDAADCTGTPRREGGLVESDEVYTSGTHVLGSAATSEEGLSIRNIDLTTDTVLGNEIFESIRVTEYDILYTGTPDQLVFGVSPGDEAADRPTALDFDMPYIRR